MPNKILSANGSTVGSVATQIQQQVDALDEETPRGSITLGTPVLLYDPAMRTFSIIVVANYRP